MLTVVSCGRARSIPMRSLLLPTAWFNTCVLLGLLGCSASPNDAGDSTEGDAIGGAAGNLAGVAGNTGGGTNGGSDSNSRGGGAPNGGSAGMGGVAGAGGTSTGGGGSAG